jgi:putative sterol carrier protein
MSLDFPSAEWVAAYKDAINANAGYKAAGKDWTHGAVAMVVKADAALGIAEDLAMVLDVHQGECRSTKFVPASAKDAQDAPFVIVAPYSTWRTVMEGQLDPTKAMMQNKLKLVKGHMPTMVKFVTASKELVASSAKVDTKFRA